MSVAGGFIPCARRVSTPRVGCPSRSYPRCSPGTFTCVLWAVSMASSRPLRRSNFPFRIQSQTLASSTPAAVKTSIAVASIGVLNPITVDAHDVWPSVAAVIPSLQEAQSLPRPVSISFASHR